MAKIEKHLKWVVFIFLIMILNIPSASAEEDKNEKTYFICDNTKGYAYITKFSTSSKDDNANVGMFYDKNGNFIGEFKSPTDEDVRKGYEKNYKQINDIKVNYAYGGYYHYNGDSRNTTRCYTTIEIEGDEQKGKATIVPKYCGERRLINIGDGEKTSGDVLITTSLDLNTGLTTVKLTANSDYLKKNWQYVEVTSIRYLGAGEDHQKSLKAVREGNSFVIYGIRPNEIRIDSDNNIKNGYGSATFSATLAIKNNEETDNVENDSLEAQKIKDTCGDYFFLGEFYTTIQDSASLKLNNTYKDSDLCNNVRNFSLASDDLKKTYIYECYNSKILYSESKNIGDTVQSKFNTLKSIYNNLNVANGGLAYVNNLLCTSQDFGLPSDEDSTTIPFERKVTYEYSGSYWGMVCVQDYYIKSDDPQLVRGGMGVHYDNRVEINKTCYIYNHTQVVKRPQCTLTVHDPVCIDPGGVTWGDTSTGGPTEEFDSCVQSCDNGKYSQSCINQCYEQVYASNRKLSLSNFKSNNSFINKITKSEKESSCSFSSYSGNSSCENGITISCNPNQYCPRNGKNGTCTVKKGDATLQTVCYSAWCDNHNGTSTNCTVSWSEGPMGCSWTPDADYNRELSVSRDEFNRLQNLMKQRSEIENYTIELIDSKDNVIYKVSGNSSENSSTASDNPRLVITEDRNKTKVVSRTTHSFNYGSNDSIEGDFVVTHRTVYDVRLPIQYSLKNNANIILIKGTKNDTYFTFNANKGNIDISDDKSYYRFMKYDLKDKTLLSGGEHVYYTSLDSHDENVKVYTSSKTKTTCGLSIGELVNKNSEYTDVTWYYLFTNRDYLFYEINDIEILDILEAYKKNIKVSINIKSFGKQAEEAGYGGKIQNFKNSEYACYYGVVNMLKETTLKEKNDIEETLDCGGEGNTGDEDPNNGKDVQQTPIPTSGGKKNSGLRYYYREIYLEPDKNGYGGIFPNRNPRWNWTGTIKDGVATGAASNKDSAYIVDPQKLIEEIEKKGDTIYGNQAEYDYVFTMTPELIRTIRNYNDSKIDGKKLTYLDFSLVGNESSKMNYAQKIKDWYGDTLYHTGIAITDCNNAINGKCYNY